MSKLQVDDIVNKDDTGSAGFSKGVVVTGVATATTFSGALSGNATNAQGLTGTPDIAVRNITGVAATFTGVLTYEDVTNIDSVGIITAQSDVVISDKIIHLGDTNTAIRFPAADTFTVETGGTERLRIDGTATFVNRCNFGSSSVADHSGKFTNGDASSSTLYVTNHNGSGDLFSGRNSSNTEVINLGVDGSATFTGTVVTGNASGNNNFTVTNGTTILKRNAATSNDLLLLGNASTTYGKVKINAEANFTNVKIGAAGAWDKISLNENGQSFFGPWADNSNAAIYVDVTGNRGVIYSKGDGNALNLAFAAYANGYSGSDRTFGVAGNGNVICGVPNVSSTTGYGVQITMAANAGDVIAQCIETASQYTELFRAYKGTTKVFAVAANGSLSITGALSKGSGSFKIDHPLPAKTGTHHLVHSFIEGPQADLIYRGYVDLVDGQATVNIDTAGRMTEGTFEVLCTNVSCFTSNESDWTAVKGSVTGNVLTITAQDATSTSKVSWMVVGERKDDHMIDTDWTDSNGRVITEPLVE